VHAAVSEQRGIDRHSVTLSAADPGGVQGVRTPAFLIRVPFLKRTYTYSVNKYHRFNKRRVENLKKNVKKRKNVKKIKKKRL